MTDRHDVPDPFSDDALRDPYPAFAALRAHAPVHHIESLDVWTVARHHDVTAVLRDARGLSSELGMNELLAGGLDPRQEARPSLMTMGPLRIVIATDPPDHTKLRRLVSGPFAAREIAALEPRIRSLCEQLVDDLLAADEPDLVAQVAYPLPVVVIAEVLGIPTERQADFKRWSDDMVGGLSGGLDPASAQASSLEMFEFFTQAVAERRANPGADVISALVARSEGLDDDQLSLPELVAFCILLLIAGNETTTNLIANAAQAFFDHPGEWAKLHADPANLAGPAVEEALRFDGPVKGLLRVPVADTAIAGVAIPAGSRVMPLFSSANRDEACFPDPDVFRVDRNPHEHLAFGYGIHHCLGAPLARLETRVLFETMASRIVELAPRGPGEQILNPILRGWHRVPVAVTAR